MNEPGAAEAKAFRIISVSLKPEDDAKLTRLRRHLEAKGSERLGISEVVRRAIDCLCEAESVK
jgi:hypothetical protein